MINVAKIELYDFIKVFDIAPSADLPQAGQTRCHTDSSAVVLIIFVEFILCRRSCADQTHITLDDIPELRELIQTCFTDEVADLCDTRIIGHLEHEAAHLIVFFQFLLPLFCIDVHGAEFINLESAAVSADSRLGEKDRAWRIHLDGNGDKGGQDQCDEKSDQAADHIGKTLDEQALVAALKPGIGQHTVIAEGTDAGAGLHGRHFQTVVAVHAHFVITCNYIFQCALCKIRRIDKDFIQCHRCRHFQKTLSGCDHRDALDFLSAQVFIDAADADDTVGNVEFLAQTSDGALQLTFFRQNQDLDVHLL